MKTTHGLLLAALASLAALFTPATALAFEPTDCTQGCYIVTCNAETCALWRCDMNGCRFLSNWPREWSESPVGRSLASAQAKAPPAVAYVKVCPAGQDCGLYQLTVDRATLVGSFDNPAELVRQREANPAPGIRAR
jgi:hypothetical protein